MQHTMPKKYKKVRYYRVSIFYTIKFKYEIFVKGNGLESSEVLDKLKTDNLLQDDMDIQYVKNIDEISREDYNKKTSKYATQEINRSHAPTENISLNCGTEVILK